MEGTEPRIVRAEDAALHPLHGDGRIRRLIYPATVASQRIFIGLAEVPPGEAPHVFHRHGSEIIGDGKLEYARDFEEFYFIVEGEGSMQWKPEAGGLTEVAVKAGDAIYMPPGVVEHRIFNSGTQTLKVLYGGSPPATVTKVARS
jgi:mannose-6-phosphate isomerase-like protein (cupin superfamily)